MCTALILAPALGVNLPFSDRIPTMVFQYIPSPYFPAMDSTVLVGLISWKVVILFWYIIPIVDRDLVRGCPGILIRTSRDRWPVIDACVRLLSNASQCSRRVPAVNIHISSHMMSELYQARSSFRYLITAVSISWLSSYNGGPPLCYNNCHFYKRRGRASTCLESHNRQGEP